MSSYQPRQPSGVPDGGQFATRSASETGTVLTAEPDRYDKDLVASCLERIAAEHQTLRYLHTTRVVLNEQQAAAMSASRNATTAAEAREAGGTLAEVQFMRATVEMEMRLTSDEIAYAEARILAATDAPRAINELMGMGQVGNRAPLIAALDAEVAQGPGHISYHPWIDPARVAAATELTEQLAAAPGSPDAAGWAEELTILRDPLHVRRARVAARKVNGPTAPEAVAYARAVAAEEAVATRVLAAAGEGH